MMLKTTKCEALVEFTRFVEGYGMVVGAPESSLDEAKKPAVPDKAIAAFADEGLIKKPKGFDADAASDEAPPAPAADAAP